MTRKVTAGIASFGLAAGVAVGVGAVSARADATPGLVTGAVYTTDATGARVNANIYEDQKDVYLNGGPNTPKAKRLAVGDYFFAVLEPGGQRDPNDTGAHNLSSPVDSASARAFHANADGTVSPLASSTHTFTNGVVQLARYDDTSNPGGEYIVAVCSFVSDGLAGAASVAPSSCKYDAFKVKESATCESDCAPGTTFSDPTGDKTATPEHDRTVQWTISKTVDPTGPIMSSKPTPVTYTVTATKSLAAETWSVSGEINVYNTNSSDLAVDVSDSGLYDDTTMTMSGALAACTYYTGDPDTAPYADGSIDGTVPAGTDSAPGTLTVHYRCDVVNPGTDTYQNTAVIGFTDQFGQPQSVATDSSPTFDFNTVTELGDPESVTVTDEDYAGAGSPSDAAVSPTGSTVSDSTTWIYGRTLFNSNCVTYTNTASLNLSDPLRDDEADVAFCGPSNGGLTMGWWQNNNGQALLAANLDTACRAVNSLLGSHTTSSDLIAASTKSTGGYTPTSCSTPASKTNTSYLPTFTYNTVKAANAAGSGAPMLLGQWLTTALDTATYSTYTSAGKPTLSSSQKVVVPNIGLTGVSSCDTVGNVLLQAVNQYGNYKSDKTKVTALITLFNNLNNNVAQTCQ